MSLIFRLSKVVVLFAAIFFASTIPTSAESKPIGKMLQAIRLNHTHYFMGTQVVTFTPNAIRVDNTAQLGFSLVAKAPDWKVTLFRLDDKTYFTEDLKTFQDTGLLSDMIIGRKGRFLDDRPLRHSTMTLYGFNIERLTSRWSTLKVMKLQGVATPPIETILYATYKLPTNGCIPLAYTATHNNADFITGMQNKGRLEVLLETTKISKVSVPASFFTAPSGMKKALSVRDVVSGHTNRVKSEAAELMLEK